MIACFFIPESPRWLASKGREEEAHAILLRFHANGAETDELVEMEMMEIRRNLEVEKLHKTTWKSLFQTPGNRKRLAVVSTSIAVVEHGIAKPLLITARAPDHNRRNGHSVERCWHYQLLLGTGPSLCRRDRQPSDRSSERWPGSVQPRRRHSRRPICRATWTKTSLDYQHHWHARLVYCYHWPSWIFRIHWQFKRWAGGHSFPLHLLRLLRHGLDSAFLRLL